MVMTRSEKIASQL